MLTINGREVDVTANVDGMNAAAGAALGVDVFADAYIDSAMWMDTEEEFTAAEYDEYEDILNSLDAGEIYFYQVV
jgi:hypothetical protein